ncbi:hypothetical protein Ssi02_69950 [Sinosporangium siamense]|uniref:Uncharacterized protein n=1 Tax=Sinosporangium siamense TaxID=1367973 RepID=A0A919RQE8_9ACTN|nr:hypothetical protein Ssi02_69950 [Sinosporangium siamense]
MSEFVIAGVTMSRRSDLEWLQRGVGRFLPEQWGRFRDGLPAPDRDGDLLAAYARPAGDRDPAVRAKAVPGWVTWEDTVISMEVNGSPGACSERPPDDLVAFVRICTHYFSLGVWLEEEVLLRDAHKPAGIPAVLITGGSIWAGRRRSRGIWPKRGSSWGRIRGTPAAPRCAPRSWPLWMASPLNAHPFAGAAGRSPAAFSRAEAMGNGNHLRVIFPAGVTRYRSGFAVHDRPGPDR